MLIPLPTVTDIDIRSEIAALRDEVRRLTDRDRIRTVFDDFAAGMDVQDWELLGSVFSADAVVDHSRQTWDGHRDEIWSGHAEVMDRMRAGVSRHFAGQHVVTNHRIWLNGDRARAVAYLHSVHVDDLDHPERHGDHGAWYLSELVRDASAPQGWRIRWMKHVTVWTAADMTADGPITLADVDEVRRHIPTKVAPGS
jgi:hypothetical protein